MNNSNIIILYDYIPNFFMTIEQYDNESMTLGQREGEMLLDKSDSSPATLPFAKIDSR